jgi:hypothetical protein
MKKILNTIAVSLILSFGILFTNNILAQTQAPPPPQTHGVGGTIPGGGAPVGEGLIFLLALGASYGAKKVYSIRRKLAE